MLSRAESSTGSRPQLTPAEGELILRATGWLNLTSVEFQDAIFAQCRWRWFEPGDAIVTAGDLDAPLVGIAAGTAAVVTAMGPADTPLSNVIHPGWWVGTVPLVSGLPTHNSTVAQTPVYGVVIQQGAVRSMLAANPSWWRFISQVMLQYAGAAATVGADLLIRESNRRCAATLLRIANCRLEGSNPVIAPVSQTDLAAVASLSRKTVNALLRDFERQGLVTRNYREIVLLDPGSLRAVADDS